MDRLYSKSTWKELFRMKPIDEDIYTTTKINSYKQEYKLYSSAQVKPMRKHTKKQRSEAQIKATNRMQIALDKSKALKELKKLHQYRNRVKKISANLIEEDVIIFDTETTGLSSPHILQITAISSKSKEVLIDTNVYTKKEIEKGAYDVHGISKEDIYNAPKFIDVYSELLSKLNGRKLTSYNTSFDFLALEYSLEEHNYILDKNMLSHHCIMQLSVSFYAPKNNYKGRFALYNAMIASNLVFQGEAHTSKADTLAALDLLHYYSSYDLEKELEKVNKDNINESI
ncbi:hypothetical protein IBE33_09210 [Francisella philomiragia]|uniref:3'-5' exonuclease n=1 Tax=Francisella philomiragia TaxID=28110 RepID=UPI00190736CD|nr:3'-5' exonuclease [Francisella philomiragia]MBK2341687.1 hypothetical protein [Francisella philomiragia]